MLGKQTKFVNRGKHDNLITELFQGESLLPLVPPLILNPRLTIDGEAQMNETWPEKEDVRTSQGSYASGQGEHSKTKGSLGMASFETWFFLPEIDAEL